MNESKAGETIERDLGGLIPRGLDDSLLRRLEGCAEGTWTRLSTEETCVENRLRAVSPAALNARQLDRFSALFEGVPVAADATVVLFPGRKIRQGNSVERKSAVRSAGWKIAAVAAFMGAMTALMLPDRKPASATVSQSPTTVPAENEAANAPAGFVQAGSNRNVDGVVDEGIVWEQGQLPERVMRVGYTERTSYKDAKGRIVEIEQPKIGRIYLPASGN